MSAIETAMIHIVETHRHDVVITCDEDCWCWVADAMCSHIAELETRNTELCDALEKRVEPLELRIKELEDNDTKLHMQFGQYSIANSELVLLNVTLQERIAELENQLEDAAEIIMGEDA